jgi:hypothetical protein
VREQYKRAWNRLRESILACQKVLITAIHLSPEEKNYFVRYVQSMAALKPSDDGAQDMAKLTDFSDSYKDFREMMMKAAQTPM